MNSRARAVPSSVPWGLVFVIAAAVLTITAAFLAVEERQPPLKAERAALIARIGGGEAASGFRSDVAGFTQTTAAREADSPAALHAEPALESPAEQGGAQPAAAPPASPPALPMTADEFDPFADGGADSAALQALEVDRSAVRTPGNRLPRPATHDGR